jgi:hypothetical protein
MSQVFCEWIGFQTYMRESRFFVAERRLSLGRRFNAGVEYGRNPRVAERRLKDAKKRRLNVETNSQQFQPSLRDWIIIRLNRR